MATTPHPAADALAAAQIPGRQLTAMIDGVTHVMADQVVSSAEVEQRVRDESPGLEVQDGIIERLTGVTERRLATDDENASDFAVRAARQLLEQTGADPREIDLVIFASSSHDMTEPATVHIVQEQLGIRANGFDLKNACNSFINAINVAEWLIHSGGVRKALVVTGEVPSRAIRWSIPDKEVWRLAFPGLTVGDGGAAMLLSPSDGERGIWYRHFASDSSKWEIMTVPGGGTRYPRDHSKTYFEGDGNSLKNAFVDLGPEVLVHAFTTSGADPNQFDAVLMHQVSTASARQSIAMLGMPEEKFDLSVATHGNMSSVTIPLQLDRAIQEGRVQEGSEILAIGLGAGISMGLMMLTL